MLVFTPAGTGEGGVCAGLAAYQAARPVETAEFMQVNLGLFIAYVSLHVIVALFWLLWRDEPVMKARGVFLHLVYCANTLALCIPVALKRAVVINGQPFMSCAALNGIYMFSMSLLAAFSLVRLMGIIHRARAVDAAIHLERIGVDSFEEERTSVRDDSRSGSEFDLSSSVRTFCGDTLHTVRIILLLVFSRSRAESSGHTDDHDAMQEQYENSLRLANQAHTTRALCIALVVFAVPTMTIFCVFVASIPAWQSAACVGCDLTVESAIELGVAYALLTTVRFKLAWEITPDADPEGFVRDMHLATLVFAVCLVTMFILLIEDPQSLDYHYVISYEWIMLVAGLVGTYVFNVKPLLLVASEKVEARIKSLEPLPDVASSLSSAVIMARFEAFAAQNYCVELVRFIEDVNTFTFLYYERSPIWRKVQAQKITNRYVSQGAIMQINVSDQIRIDVENLVVSDNVPQTVFDPAMHEAFVLIEQNAQLWRAFVAQGGCKLDETSEHGTSVRRRSKSSRSNSKTSTPQPSPFSSALPEGRKRLSLVAASSAAGAADISPFALTRDLSTQRYSKASTRSSHEPP